METDVMKHKQKDSVILPIIEIIEGKGKLSGSCGQVICEGNDKDHFYKVSVSGQTMCKETRDLLWEHWINGFTLPEIRIMGDCTMESGVYHTLRQPRFDAYIWR